MGGLTELSAACYGAVIKVLRDEYPLPAPTRYVENASGYPATRSSRDGTAYGMLAYRMLRRAVSRGEAEQIKVPDMKSAYWRYEPACEAGVPPPPGTVLVPRYGPGPRPAPADTQGIKITVYGRAQIDTFAAMCALRGRAPYELAYDILLEAIRAAHHDHETQHLVRLMQDAVLVFGGPRSTAGRREMMRLLNPDVSDG